MKVKVLVFFVFHFMNLFTQETNDEVFRANFDKARAFLLEGKTSKALPILQELSSQFPNNSNINYLLGVCFIEQEDVNDYSIYFLEKAQKDVTLDYSPSSYLEKRAPVFLYYFLVVAYAQNRLCRKAENAFYQFHSLYGVQKSDFYVNDAKNWVNKCELPKELANEIPHVEKALEVDTSSYQVPVASNEYSGKKTYITKKIEYTTSKPLYGVQVGAYSKLIPIYKFDGLKNVDAFMDHEGMIRYVIGHFGSKIQAETLLEVIKSKGYPDAFIVDVNSERKYSDELVIFNDKSIHKKSTDKKDIDFSVQIGAFRDSIPSQLAEKYLLVDHIEEYIQDDLTILMSGKFKKYQEAKNYKDQLLSMGIPGVFIIAFNHGVKVPVEKHMISLDDE